MYNGKMCCTFVIWFEDDKLEINVFVIFSIPEVVLCGQLLYGKTVFTVIINEYCRLDETDLTTFATLNLINIDLLRSTSRVRLDLRLQLNLKLVIII